MKVEILSVFRADAWGGFDFNGDQQWAPGRAFKGGKNAYLQLNDDERIECSNMWVCLVDVSSCMNLRWWSPKSRVNFVEAINLVHLHELSHACDNGKSERYDYGKYSHTHRWNKILEPVSIISKSRRI